MARVASVLAAALAAVTTVGCGSAPTQPSKNPTLAIRPPASAIVLGKSQSFAAWLTDSNGDRQLDARWAVSDQNVATVSAAGTVSGVRLGTTTLTATYADLRSDRALAIVNDFAGHWQGIAKITSCTRQSGEGPNTCGAEVGLTLPMDLELTQDGSSIAGTATLHKIDVTGPVTGTSTPTGSMTLAGTLRTSGDHAVQMVITNWDTAIDPTSRLTGTFRITDTFQNAFGPQVHLEIYEVVSAVRNPS